MAQTMEDRVEAAAAEYLQAVDRGAAPDRAEFLKRYPDLAAELNEFLDDLAHFHVISTPRALDTPADPAATATFNGGPIVSAPERPIRIAGYEIVGEVGRGGMGIVYRARQLSINRLVALKTVSPDRLGTHEDRDRFLREAEAAATLEHPNIVPIYEVGECDGRSYFTMKLVEGGSLADHRNRYYSDPRGAANLVARIARAVHYAHQRGILHRDLKPSNVLLDPSSEPMVADFGLAKRLDGPADNSGSGIIVGTPAYMAPEQARGAKGLTTAADVYGLGAILYELLTDRPPYRAPSPAETLAFVLRGELSRPRSINPRVSADLEAICLKCLSTEPSSRYGSAEALAAELGHWLAGEPIEARPARLLERGRKWIRRNPTLTALTGVAAVAVGAIIWAAVALAYNAQLADAKRRAENAYGDMEVAKDELADALARETAEKQEAARLRTLAEDRERQIARLLYTVRFREGAGLLRDGLVDQATERLPAPNDRTAELTGVEWAVLPIRPAQSTEIGREWHTVSRSNSMKATPRVVTDFVAAVAFDPSGSRIAVAERPAGLRLYDAASGKELSQFNNWPRPAPITDSWPQWFVSEGARLQRIGRWWPGTVCADLVLTKTTLFAIHPAIGSVTAWDMATGRFDRAYFLPENQRLARWAVSDDARWVAATADGKATVWDARSGQINGRLDGMPKDSGPMAISHDGELLVTGGEEPCAWNVRDGQLVRRLKLSSTAKPWQGLAFLPGTQEIVAADGNGLLHWLPKTDSTPALLLSAEVNRVGVSPDGRVITGTGQKGVYLIRPSGKLIARWLTDHPPILAACATDTLIGVASAGSDRLVRVGIGGLNAARYHEIACSTEVRSLSFNKDGSIAAGLTKEGIRVWSVPDGRILHDFDKLQDGQQRPMISPCGQFLAVNSSTGAKVYDLRTGSVSAELKAPPDKPIRFISGDVAFSPDGELLAAANTYVINVWRIRNGELLHSFPADQPLKRHGYWAITVAFSPDGRSLATGSGTWYTGGPDTAGGITKIWDVGTGELLRQFPPQLDGIYGLAWSPDGKWLATGSGIYQRSDRAAVKVWDARTGDLVYDLKGHTECVWNVAFSPDGRRLTSGSGPCTVYNRRKGVPDQSEIRIWDMTTGLELLTLHDSGSTDYAATFSPDGRWFGTAGANGIIRLWEMEPAAIPLTP